MALTHLADTSVLTRLAASAVRDVIQPKVDERVLGRVSVSDLEVGYLARSGPEWDRLMRALDVLELVETTADHFRRARQVQRLLAVKHQRGRKFPDLLVAAVAEARDLVVLHYDADFDRIASVTGQQCEWVVPAAPSSESRVHTLRIPQGMYSRN